MVEPATNTAASLQAQSTLYTNEAKNASAVFEKCSDVRHEPFAIRDSGVFLEDAASASTPPPATSPTSLNRTLSVNSTSVSSPSSPPTLQRTGSAIRRLQRPAELNLYSAAALDASKPKSELELRYDLIRNSQTQSKAALKSSTQLLKDRLNMSPRKARHDEKARIFTPPRPMLNGCILPGPAAQMGAFTGSSVRARTENGRPAWWCKIDKLVVFDGAEEQDIGETNFYTRTSKGLSAARRRGETETVIIPMDCSHCQEMLNRREWKYDIQVCKRSVCWDCGERCRWELSEEHKSIAEEEDGRPAEKTQSPRERADSVLQDEQIREEVLLTKAGIERGASSSFEVAGGIVVTIEPERRGKQISEQAVVS